MESSTVLAFRIFVMLSCLIIVPMAAIFGSAFPDVVKSVLVDRIVAWSTGKLPVVANQRRCRAARGLSARGASAAAGSAKPMPNRGGISASERRGGAPQAECRSHGRGRRAAPASQVA